jgi:hypothetical protein
MKIEAMRFKLKVIYFAQVLLEKLLVLLEMICLVQFGRDEFFRFGPKMSPVWKLC